MERVRFYARVCAAQAKRVAKARAQCRAKAFRRETCEKKISCRSVHRKYTNVQQFFHSLTRPTAHTTLGRRLFWPLPAVTEVMDIRRTAVAVLAAALLLSVHAAAADDPVLLRVFLADGTSLVSYGEPARVGDRVIFSMPTATGPNPPLHLVNLPIARVDWDRTSRYTATVQGKRYLETQADADYAALSNDVAATLNEVVATADPRERLAIVERARKALAEWPQNHYNYRQAEVKQMLAMLDEAIADLEAATGRRGQFTLTLSAFADPVSTAPEPPLPPPTPREAIEQVLLAARSVDSAAERTSLLTTAVAAIDRDKDTVPAAWAATTKADTQAQVRAELDTDRRYRSLTNRMMAIADMQARMADVPALLRLLDSIPRRDAGLGNRRPDAVAALVSAVEAKLDAARQLQLARDRFALRVPVLRQYRQAIETPMLLFAQIKPALEAVKALSGSTPEALELMQRNVARILSLAAAIAPPQEAAAAHALLVSATQLAGNAAQIRREATLAGDMPRAWDASSAAAGALMLGAKARTDIQTSLRLPQLR